MTSPVVVSTTRRSTAMYASCLCPPTEKPWKLSPPPPPDVFSWYDETVPRTRYWAPVSLPTFAAVPLATRPDAARSCSLRTCSSFERSTTRNFSVVANSFVSMLLRSLPAPPYHHAAAESLRKSATPMVGLLDASAAEVINREQTDNRNAALRFMKTPFRFGRRRHFTPRFAALLAAANLFGGSCGNPYVQIKHQRRFAVAVYRRVRVHECGPQSQDIN